MTFRPRRRVAVAVAVIVIAATGLVAGLAAGPGARRPSPPAAGTQAPLPASTPASAPASPAPGTPAASPPTGPATVQPAPARTGSPRRGPGPSRSPNPATPDTRSLDELLRNGPVPDGVADQMGVFYGGQPRECPGPVVPTVAPTATAPTPVPTVYALGKASVPGYVTVCLWEFSSSDPVTLVITDPEGTTSTVRLPTGPNSRYGDSIFLGVGHPAGRYRIRAIQGEISATGQFTVERPASPVAWVLPDKARAGSTFAVQLGGFGPGGLALLHLYSRVAGPTIRYRAAMRWRADAAGEIRLTLRTSATTEPGTYYLHRPPTDAPPTRPGTIYPLARFSVLR